MSIVKTIADRIAWGTLCLAIGWTAAPVFVALMGRGL